MVPLVQRSFSATTNRFLTSVGQALQYRARALAIFAGVIALAVAAVLVSAEQLRAARGPGLPHRHVQLPDGATLERTGQVSGQFQRMLPDYPEFEHVIVINGSDFIGGGNKTNAGTLFIMLKHWDDRDRSAADVAKELNQRGSTIRGGTAVAFNPPAIRGLGTAGGFEGYLQARGSSDPLSLGQVLREFQQALAADPRLTGINTFFRASVPQLRVEVDREKAMALGVPVNDVFEALQSTMGALYVNDFNMYGRTYRVQMQAEAPYRNDPTTSARSTCARRPAAR